MNCPKCGYMMQASDKDCPRCVPAFVITPTIAPPPIKPPPTNPVPPRAPSPTALPPRAPLKMEKPREPITPIQIGVGIILAVGMFFLLLQFRSWRQDQREQRNAQMYAPFSGGPPSAVGPQSNPGAFPGQLNTSPQMAGTQRNQGSENLQKMQQQTNEMHQRNLEQLQQQSANAQARLSEMQRQNMERMQNMNSGPGGARGIGPGAIGPGGIGPGPQFGGGGFGRR